MAKKKNIKKKNTKVEVKENDKKLIDMLFTAFGVLAFFLIFYLYAFYVTNKHTVKEDKTDDSTEAKISYENIMVGKTFNMSDKEYYVLYCDLNSEFGTDCTDIAKEYRDGNKGVLYIADMSNMFNKGYVSEESNKTPSKASDIKVNGPTVMKIQDHKLIDYIEGIDSIRNYLK